MGLASSESTLEEDMHPKKGILPADQVEASKMLLFERGIMGLDAIGHMYSAKGHVRMQGVSSGRILFARRAYVSLSKALNPKPEP